MQNKKEEVLSFSKHKNEAYEKPEFYVLSFTSDLLTTSSLKSYEWGPGDSGSEDPWTDFVFKN